MNRVLTMIGLELTPTNHLDKVISGVGGFAAIGMLLLITRWLAPAGAVMPVVASMGASAVLLFAAPHGQLSQPWPLAMGHLVSALVGVTCARLIVDPVVAGGVAVGVSVTAMYYLRCIHPPGGATALTAILGGPALRAIGYEYVIVPVLANVGLMLAVAVAFNYVFRWRRYPAGLSRFRDSGSQLRREDWSCALGTIGTLSDVSEDELVELHALAVRHAADRRQGRQRPPTP